MIVAYGNINNPFTGLTHANGSLGQEQVILHSQLTTRHLHGHGT